MAEPSDRHRGRLVEVFLSAYNGLHGTMYANPPDPEEPGGACDFRWPGSSPAHGPLEVQHTRGALDQLHDRVHPLRCSQLHAAVQGWCDSRRLKGFGVSLGLMALRRRSPSVRELAEFVVGKLEQAMLNPPQPGVTHLLHPLRPYADDPFPEIRLQRLPTNTRTLVVSSPTPLSAAIVVEPRLREAIDRKQDRWLHGQVTNLVLLVEFDVDGYDGDDLADMRRQAAASRVLFREIWGISLWTPGERADRLWP